MSETAAVARRRRDRRVAGRASSRRWPRTTRRRGGAVRRRQLLARPRRLHLEHQDARGPGGDPGDARGAAPATCSRAAGRTTEPPSEADGVTEAWIAFETAVGRGRGHLRLRDGKAWTLLTTLAELKGHEEPKGDGRPPGASHGAHPDRAHLAGDARARGARARHTRCSPTSSSSAAGRAASPSARGCASSASRRSSSSATRGPATPGATATSRSACTTRSGTTTCRTSSSPRTGRCSRRRTRSATGSRCTRGSWSCNYWGSTEAKSRHATTRPREWSVVVERDGAELTLRPKQLVMATGMSGKPNMPEIPGMDVFSGDQHHSSQHPGPDAYEGKTARRHRLEQLRARHLRGALGGRAPT